MDATADAYYVQHICTPTRQALLSGRYQIHTGLQHGIIQNSQKSCLPPSFATMADVFKVGGYSTHMIGEELPQLARESPLACSWQ
jgi:arylsulfatase A-like enzyme